MDSQRLKQTIINLEDAKLQYKNYEKNVMENMHLFIDDNRLKQFIHDFIHMYSTIQAINKYSDVILEYIKKNIII